MVPQERSASHAIGGGRAWDCYDAYLFDIDGTLLNCTDAVHYFAFCQALTELAGKAINLDGVVTHGNTDCGILRDALTLHGIEEAHWRPRLPEAQKQMCGFVRDRRMELRIRVLPAVRDVLRHLAERGAVLGVATGNLETIGWIKLRNCSLESCFQFGGFSDGFESRTDVFRAALTEARRRTDPGAAICVVGDTPADIRAARELGLDAIAVATGIYKADQLAAESPYLCLGSLAELFPQSPLWS